MNNMNENRLKGKGRYMSKLLRHDPEELPMNGQGYVEVSDLLEKLSIEKEDLDWIVENNNKKRFSYNEDETLIRANQGHNKNLNVKVEMEEAPRMEILYHGTATENVPYIMKDGLISKSRQHVHLSKDVETAKQVGSRHSKNITILKIDSARMRGDGIKIWISANGVYLTDLVDPKYISK
jgi:putative RNA 2'-phosphotransferase